MINDHHHFPVSFEDHSSLDWIDGEWHIITVSRSWNEITKQPQDSKAHQYLKRWIEVHEPETEA